ncbi:MAG: AMP-binding protein, partial [Armatimonadota bacterium]
MDREAPTDFLDACLRAAAARHADRLALDLPPGDGRASRRTFTYAQLVAEVDAWGAALADLGVGRGDLVAVWCDRCDPAAYAAPVAAMERGAAWVSIDPSFPDGHVARILSDATPAALVVDPAREVRARTVAADRAVARRREGSIDPPPPIPRESRDPSDPAYLIYTSGTTGLPKGVVIPHRGIVNLIRSDRSAFDLGPGDRLAQGSSHAYDSSVEEIWMAWDTGATVVAMDDATSRLGPDL